MATSEDVEKVEDFYGVYLLISQSPNSRFKGRAYVGFTVDPERRLKQHNGGHEAGGAKRTSNRGPWAMVLIVHGFPNMISALRFEWAWQHPKRSRRLNTVPAKKKSENAFKFHIRLLSEMLNIGPWCRLPLSVRWLRPDLKGTVDFPAEKPPPMHMPVLYGQIKAVKLKKKSKKKTTEEPEDSTPLLCGLCFENVPVMDLVKCLSTKCESAYHLVCLANSFRARAEETDELGRKYFLPIDGNCPVCDVYVLWGDLIRKKKGCYQNVNVIDDPQVI